MTVNNKKAVRDKFKKIRNSISDKNKKEKQIKDNVISLGLIENADIIFLYAATGSEVNIDYIAEKALSEDKKVAFPVCIDENGKMEFYFINNLNELNEGMYSIREPNQTTCEKAFFTEKSVCFVPGLCFEKNGGRIGYGKGYYDRFLNKFNGTTVGISFEECVTDELKLEPHDKTVTYLITDKTIYNFDN